MNPERLRRLLYEFKKGRVDINNVIEKIKDLPYKDLGFAKVDHHRALRQGFAEVIYSSGKTPEQIKQIAMEIIRSGSNLLATRASRRHYQAIKSVFKYANYDKLSSTVTCIQRKIKMLKGYILIVTAGTSDIPVAQEAKVTCEMMGCRVKTVFDVGVAGVHRLLKHMKLLQAANVIIVIAGMDAALASVIGGLVASPVIAVPTSTGYGANFKGLSSLLTMLNSCSANVSVVNINNGFGAGSIASIINRKIATS